MCRVLVRCFVAVAGCREAVESAGVVFPYECLRDLGLNGDLISDDGVSLCVACVV